MTSTNQSSNGYTKIQYRLIYCEPGKPAEDRSSDTSVNFPLEHESELARDILREYENRLLLLQLALEGKQSIDASLVRTVVDDVLLEIKEDAVVPAHLERLARIFKHAEILPPVLPVDGTPKLEVISKRKQGTQSMTEPSLVG